MLIRFSLFLALILSPFTAHSELLVQTARPPNYETPKEYFKSVFTPNDHFFVRSHLPVIPKIDVKSWKLKISGDAAAKSISFSMTELKNEFKQVEIAALTYCAGNGRSQSNPPAPGIQWGYGAMGNARWKGIRLKDVLEKSGIKKEAIEITFVGADSPVNEKGPDYRKSIPLAKALDENTLIAFEMNGEPLPELHGFPARIVVPGWAATYWVKQLKMIEISSKPEEGFWMKKGYRVNNVPITEINVNSMITNPEENQLLKKDTPFPIQGLAWDGGHGITKVEISLDDGKTWETTQLGEDYGPYSWRQFNYHARFKEKGEHTILIKATNRMSQTQPEVSPSNPSGYLSNGIQHLKVRIDTPPRAVANESKIVLKPGPGRALIEKNCTLCHSLDYLSSNARILDKKGWEKEVNKMITEMRAAIPPEDVPEIVKYLSGISL